jgi:hypothetical protein
LLSRGTNRRAGNLIGQTEPLTSMFHEDNLFPA